MNSQQLHPLRYGFTVVILICLLVMDLCINAISNYSKWAQIKLLVLFVTQDAGILLTVIILLLSFFQTYLFKVGLMKLLFARFFKTILICIVYFALSVGLHVWFMLTHWNEKDQTRPWSESIVILYGVQRFVSSFYYYSCKRAGLRLSDPRFYEDQEWIAEQLKKLPNK